MRFTGRIEKRHDGRIEPEQTAVLGTIANLAMPDPSAGDGLPHLLEKRLGVMAGVEHAVAAADYLRSAVTGDRAKRVIDRHDHAVGVRSEEPTSELQYTMR